MATAERTQHASKDCILFATADWDTPYWTNKQHTAAHLAEAGWRVLYVESIGLRPPKLGSGTDWGRIFRRLGRGLRGPRQVSKNLWVYSPLLVPFRHDHPWIRTLNRGLLSGVLRWFVRRRSFSRPMVWTYHPYIVDLLGDLDAGPLVYHCVDDLAAIPGVDAEAFNQAEVRLLKVADHVFTTSPALQAKCSRHHPNVVDLPNVVDAGHFGQALESGPLPEDLAAIPAPRLVYVGALSDFKVDFALLHALAQRHPEWSFVLIGEEREGQHDPTLSEMRKLANVHTLGHKPYAALPQYLRGISVGLLPTRVNDYTRSMFPMKYFEYLAAGVPVASTPLEFTRNNHVGLCIGHDIPSFSRAIHDQLQRGRLTPNEAAEFVGENTWSRRLEKMLQIVNGTRG